MSQAFRYDAAGNRTTVQKGNTIATETPNVLNQLTGVAGGGMKRFVGTLSKPGTVTVGGNPATMSSDNKAFEGYASVAVGATTRVHIVATDGDGAVTDKYTDITPDAVAAQAFQYDPNGNTKASGPAGASPNFMYGWDAADRLVSVAANGGSVTTFEYDGLGRRVREKVNNVETRHWVWDGLKLCEERAVDNSVAKRFFGQGEQIEGASYYFTRDHLGSVRELLDNTGNVTTGGLRARYDYDLYGSRKPNAVTGINAVESDFGFTGHQEFVFGGLEMVGAPLRFYQPAGGRWLSRDPIGESGGWNLYVYCGNNPVNAIDPEGTTWVWNTSPFPGSQGPEQYGPYTRYMDDGDPTAIRQLRCLSKRQVRQTEVQIYLLLQERSPFDALTLDEGAFDTKYYRNKDEGPDYYLYNNQVISGNNLSYIGIGMYEAWAGDPEWVGNAIVHAYKRAKYWEGPSQDVLDSFHKGFTDYNTLRDMNIHSSEYNPYSGVRSWSVENNTR